MQEQLGSCNVYSVWFCVEEVLMKGGREAAFCTDPRLSEMSVWLVWEMQLFVEYFFIYKF